MALLIHIIKNVTKKGTVTRGETHMLSNILHILKIDFKG